MMPFKKILQLIVTVCICSFTFNVFAVDQTAKEETIPPGDDGPLTAEQIPPINSPPETAKPQKLPTGSPAQSSQPENPVPPP